jgi:FKBP-type peptidyl-prolyl cis-trans isomerase
MKRFYNLVVCSAFLVSVISGCGEENSTMGTTQPAVPTGPAKGGPVAADSKAGNPQGEKIVTTATGLQYVDQVIGTGAEAKPGMNVSVHYTGWLTNGTKFDSSKDRGQPFEFPLGMGRVIRGWDEGVAGMKIGGKRKLTIPSELGYGARGAGGAIPPNATLVFEVELLGVK